MTSLKDFDDAGLKALAVECGGAPFRAAQLKRWLWAPSFAASYDEMTNLPRDFRSRLEEKCSPFALKPCRRLEDPEDGTVKWLSELEDGNTIETVLMRVPGRTTVCISTQVGCTVRCVFCASGRGGLKRNLTTAEIIDQVILASREAGARVDNIVVMGMGEPLMNLEALIPALDIMAAEDTLGLGARHVTISTSGIVPGIIKLADTGRCWNLALSLHAVNDEKRRLIIPDANRYPLEEIFHACEYHRSRTNRMLTLEFALLAGVNDDRRTMEELAVIARRLRAKVNLIPCNPGGSRHTAPEMRNCRGCLAQLEKLGVQATLRISRGAGILAACGQLRQRTEEKNGGSCASNN